MEKSNLVQYLSLLTPDEMQRFRLFLASPFHNRGELPLKLFDFLMETLAKRERIGAIPEIPLPNAYEALYGKTEFKGQRLRRIKMELFRLLTSFIDLQDERPFSPGFTQEFHLRKFLLDRGGLQSFQKRTSKSRNDIPKAGNPIEFWERYQLGLLNYEFCIHAGIPTDDMENTLDDLDQYYFTSKLRLWASILNREKGYDQKHRLNLVEESLEILESPVTKDWHAAHLWKNVLGLVYGKNEKASYQNIMAILGANNLPYQELRQVRGFIYNYLNSQEKARRETYMDLWKLLKIMLEEGTLHSKGKINGPFFRATVFNACLAGQATWARNFLTEYGNDLKGNEVEQQISYFNLHISFYEKRFEEIPQKAALLKFKSKRFEIYVKALQIKVAFEMKAVDDFFRLVDAFQKYLSSKQDPGSQFVDRYIVFAKWVSKLGRARFDQRPLPKVVEKELLESKVSELFWLWEKCVELL